MINLGIVLAVTEYSGDTSRLPACKQDGDAVAQILRSDGKFNDILIIDRDTTSSAVKAKLIAFLTGYKGQSVQEIVFYFTGHGDFAGSDFFYLLSDYDKNRIRQTSLENSELDNLVWAEARLREDPNFDINHFKKLFDFARSSSGPDMTRNDAVRWAEVRLKDG